MDLNTSTSRTKPARARDACTQAGLLRIKKYKQSKRINAGGTLMHTGVVVVKHDEVGHEIQQHRSLVRERCQ